ncbi:hypothetical protein AB0L57_01045 [Nocardia sp. NPDC052254]|uniref:hypothetical protein n=1 Tax=Nocardia sp. NPDC052254 TaxID=3155681 RepID=UPI00342F7E2D
MRFGQLALSLNFLDPFSDQDWVGSGFQRGTVPSEFPIVFLQGGRWISLRLRAEMDGLRLLKARE